MQKVIINKPAVDVIKLSNLTGKEIIAYRSNNSDNYCLLAKLSTRDDMPNHIGFAYGFVPLSTSNASPRYASQTWKESIRLAGATHDIMKFNSMNEMLTAMVNKTF